MGSVWRSVVCDLITEYTSALETRAPRTRIRHEQLDNGATPSLGPAASGHSVGHGPFFVQRV